jgi:hypothetical protein
MLMLDGSLTCSAQHRNEGEGRPSGRSRPFRGISSGARRRGPEGGTVLMRAGARHGAIWTRLIEPRFVLAGLLLLSMTTRITFCPEERL